MDENGYFIKVYTAKSSGNKPFDKSAVKAAYKNLFKSAIKDGKPIKLWVTYKVDFLLK